MFLRERGLYWSLCFVLFETQEDSWLLSHQTSLLNRAFEAGSRFLDLFTVAASRRKPESKDYDHPRSTGQRLQKGIRSQTKKGTEKSSPRSLLTLDYVASSESRAPPRPLKHRHVYDRGSSRCALLWYPVGDGTKVRRSCERGERWSWNVIRSLTEIFQLFFAIPDRHKLPIQQNVLLLH